MSLITSIWSTPEAYAWAGGHKYEDYLRIHAEHHATNKPLSLDHYQALCELFDKFYEDDLK